MYGAKKLLILLTLKLASVKFAIKAADHLIRALNFESLYFGVPERLVASAPSTSPARKFAWKPNAGDICLLM